MKNLILFVSLFYSLQIWALEKIEDKDLLNYFFTKAAKYSQITNYQFEQIPPIFRISKNELMKTVCPENPSECERLAAVFDDIGFRILIRDDFEITQNFKAFDYSFVIHEIVHSLQYLQNGPEIFNGCEAIYNSEKQAYQAQDNYLKDEGDFFRAGIALNYFYCDESIALKDYEKSKKHWDNQRKN